MGVETRRLDTRRPPLPAPTESMDEQSGVETEVATNITTRTDKSSYSIPDDGRPITISTQKVTSGKSGSLGQHGRHKSQTSLLIEYFEASKSGDKSRTRPSVRVKVTPSSTKKSKGAGNDAIQITGIGKDRKPSYTRRISFGNSKNIETGKEETESHSSESYLSQGPPVEIEVLNNSDVSQHRSSRGLMYAPVESNVSSMPPDSMLEGGNDASSDGDVTPRDDDYLKAPMRSRSRSDSRERITQRVMEKLNATPTKPRKSSRSSQDRGVETTEHDDVSRERRRRATKSHRYDDSVGSGAESSLISSNPTASQRSYRSDRSQASRMTNNLKLLEMVEDTIKRVIQPEINALKEDQRADRNLRTFERAAHGSSTPGDPEKGSLERRVSKSSSSPNIVSKPKVVLNRDGDDPGTVLSRGDSERIKPRKSSGEAKEKRSSGRLSSGRNSRGVEDIEEEEKTSRRSRKGSHGARDATAAALAGGALTAAALMTHDSRDELHERRKRRSKSRGGRSRSVGNVDANEDVSHKTIPSMPFESRINDSEMTRESILSQGSDTLPASGFQQTHTPIREVSRGSLGGAKSPASSRTPTRTPLSRSFGPAASNQPIESPRSSNNDLPLRSNFASTRAANVSDERHIDADGYGTASPQRPFGSPVQSVSSLKKRFEDDESLVPQGLRPRSAASRSSAARLHDRQLSQGSLQSAGSSPTSKQPRSRLHSRNDSTDEYETPQERRISDFAREGSATPSREDMKAWFNHQHEVNEHYRDSLGEPANRDSYQTNPYPQDEKRFTQFTDDSLDQRSVDDDLGTGRDVHTANGGLNPEFVHTPIAVESAVASLMEPSTVSSNVLSSNDSATKDRGSYSERMAEQLRSMGRDDVNMDEPAADYKGSTVSQNMRSQDRWAALKARAISSNSAENINSPRQSPAKSAREVDSIAERPVMGANGLPVANDPMPEIGYFDDSKSLTTNPSFIQGPLGGDIAGNDPWPYTPEQGTFSNTKDLSRVKSSHDQDEAMLMAGAAVAGAAASIHKPTVEDEYEDRHTPDVRSHSTHAANRENGFADNPAASPIKEYLTKEPARSAGGLTPKSGRNDYGQDETNEYREKVEDQDDPFAANSRHKRALSGNSHGMSSPLYDGAMGNGIDRIQSRDIVALMDLLTVRDAQRNARDTEILVSLVRSAAEMRQSFDEMKRFITEQDKLIMLNAERGAEQTAQRVLGGPRPQPTSSPRTARREMQSEEDLQTKRKGVLRRALKGLTGGKSSRDLAKIEDMLAQVLDNVEDLKHQGGQRPGPAASYTSDSLDSYQKLRAVPDVAYEPEVRAVSASTPNQSGYYPTTPREKQQFHSGYDGRRGSDNRVSTVLEEDDDDDDVLEPHESVVLNNQFENNEQLLTPTQEHPRPRGFGSSAGTPPRQGPTSNDRTPRTTERERKHKSAGSSIFGMSVPKVSRWSKTTASSAAPDFAAIESPKNARHYKGTSEASRSGSALDNFDFDDEEEQYYDRVRSTHSLAQDQAHNDESRSMRSQGSRLTRTPSPLIPSEASLREAAPSPVQEDSEAGRRFDNPKYQAVRNSLLLQHPQPRQGPTGRHQDTLETHAQDYEEPVDTNSDVSRRTEGEFDPAVWGSTAPLARQWFPQSQALGSGNATYSNGRSGGGRDEGPLVPQSMPLDDYDDEDSEPDWDEPQYSNSGFGKWSSTNNDSSPFGKPLEPIEEVRASLEMDRHSVSPVPQVAKAVAARKITGPRPMGGHNSGATPASGTVRRKPVPYSGASDGSADSETF